MTREKNRVAEHGIMALWTGWALSVGSIVLVVLLSLLVSKMWLPLIALGLEVTLLFFVRSGRESEGSSCYLIPFVCSRILFCSAVVMVIINMVYLKLMPQYMFETGLVNRDIPYITSLITAPVSMLVAGWAIIRGPRMSFCVDCTLRNGDRVERGFLGHVYSKEGRYQLKLLFMLSAVNTLFGTLYYFIFYINVNLNSPDRFMFVGVPVILWALSVVYLGFRYFSLMVYYNTIQEDEFGERERSTILRYLIVSGDYMYLREKPSAYGDRGRYDTPAFIHLPYREQVSQFDARSFLGQIVRLGNYTLRFLYHNTVYRNRNTVYHYVCFIPDRGELDETVRNKGEWFTMPQIEQLLNSNRIAPMLASEVMRLYTVSMARKAYDRRGHRLYKIKNYRPTFRLSDIEKLDVDFNDSEWLRVAMNNEDKPFFHLRKFWRRYIGGIHY